MSVVDDRLRDANWERMREVLDRAATEYHRIANELVAIQFDDAAGARRSPDAVISQAALTASAGRVYSEMIHRLATWAESINDVDRHSFASQRCAYKLTDPAMVCVLEPGHTYPLDGGLPVHVTSDGVTFR